MWWRSECVVVVLRMGVGIMVMSSPRPCKIRSLHLSLRFLQRQGHRYRRLSRHKRTNRSMNRVRARIQIRCRLLWVLLLVMVVMIKVVVIHRGPRQR